MSHCGDGIIPQLFLFKDFLYDGTNITYNEAESNLKNIFQLLKNEVIDFCFPVKLQIPHNNKLTLYATNWAIRIIFDNPIIDSSLFRNFVIPLKTIFKMEKEGHESINMGKFGVKFYFSSGGHLTFEFPKIEGIRTSFIKRIEYLKKHRLNFPEGEWTPDPTWIHRISETPNYDFLKNEYCKTYPLYFVIPKDIPLYYIRAISHFRSHERFPIISYFYIPPGTNDRIALMRSSQPSTLFKKSKKSYEDEYLSSVCGDHGLSIIDCRPKKTAVAYEFIGKGYESTKGYKKHISHVEFHFLGIPHAYKVRHFYISMLKEIFHGKSSSYKKWGELTMQILDGASFVVNCIVTSSNAVLVHCSDGWDRTSQICALSQVLIDPYYRTVKGFIELIQKDWIDMGHLFCARCGHVKSVDFNETSPIFGQFIDAVAQLMNKYQMEFEFNLVFLEIILSSAYSQLFGDFMGNNYIERLEMKRPTSIFPCFEDESFGLADKIKNNQYHKSNNILLMKKNEKYKFFPELLGSPVFFSDEVPLITKSPPKIKSFSIYDLERLSLENKKERKIALKRKKNNKNYDDSDSTSDNDSDDDNDPHCFGNNENESNEDDKTNSDNDNSNKSD